MKKLFHKPLEKVFITFWAVKQLIIAAPKEFFSLFSLVFLQGIIPGVSLLVVEKVVNWISFTGEIYFPLMLTSLWILLLLVDAIASPFVSIIRIHLNERVLSHSNILLIKKANSFETLEPFENSLFYDQIQFLKDESRRRPMNFVYIIVASFKEIITLGTVLIVLSSLKIDLPFLILLAAIPRAIATMSLEKNSWDQMLFQSPQARKMAWLSGLSLDEKSAKEIRLFGFGDFIVERYRESAQLFSNILGIQGFTKNWGSNLLSIISVAGNFFIFLWVIFQAKSGNIGVGAIAVVFQAFIMAQLEISNLMQNVAMLIPVLKFFGKFKFFIERKDFNLSFSAKGKRIINAIHTGICFENVSFVYPDGRYGLKNINLQVCKGDKIALVGENGAGKTTLIKLLVRFYDPTEGRITIDGIDLKELDLNSWRNQLSAIFQDFCQYHFDVGENIALSNPTLFHQSKIKIAAKKAGFDSVVGKLPQGYDTLLGKEFGGTSLSGGEWQKLAMARAFIRDAEIFILDEPTSALDPRSEYDVFERFASQLENRTVFFITHRLGSINMANRIVVLKKGEIIEQGTHQELIESGGEYAILYKMQASRYQKINHKEELLDLLHN